jgi:pimeloyl-ACP methyl ester carboxylesterase
MDWFVELTAAAWGTDDYIRLTMPSFHFNGPEEIASYARIYRASATPRSAAAQYNYFLRDVDVRSFLPLVQAPTLVLSAAKTSFLPREHGRYLAEHLPRATLVEWPGALHPTWKRLPTTLSSS